MHTQQWLLVHILAACSECVHTKYSRCKSAGVRQRRDVVLHVIVLVGKYLRPLIVPCSVQWVCSLSTDSASQHIMPGVRQRRDMVLHVVVNTYIHCPMFRTVSVVQFVLSVHVATSTPDVYTCIWYAHKCYALYSETSLIWTPLEQKAVSWLMRCSDIRGRNIGTLGVWGSQMCPVYWGVLISGTSLVRVSTVYQMKTNTLKHFV